MARDGQEAAALNLGTVINRWAAFGVAAAVGALLLKFQELCSSPVLYVRVTVRIYCLSFRNAPVWRES